MLCTLRKAHASRIAVAGLTLWGALGGGPLMGRALAGGNVTPIEHVVIIFQENVSFDHYFATYPIATNPKGEPAFHAASGTPTVNGLNHDGLLLHNTNQVNPFRFDRSQPGVCDQNHDYLPEQAAYHAGLLDLFVEFTGTAGQDGTLTCKITDTMGYYDGNTVTALWNYAQHYAMSDNSFNTTFGPSTPGAINLVSGQTHGATPGELAEETTQGTLIGDPRPFLDDCSPSGGGQANQVIMSGKNVGDLMNDKGITWGFFQGGFRPTATVAGKAVCGSSHIGANGLPKNDYIPHHAAFQYYASTANPHHLPPTSAKTVGKTDKANHQYDLADFWVAADAGNVPAVSYLKAAAYQDGHAAYSDPLSEQTFVVETINRLQALPEWESMAVIIAYDDSDGFYDHAMPPIISQSNTAYDALTGPGQCGTAKKGAYQGRCGYGPRTPLLVISRLARVNFVDHGVTDQTSILRFIEDNWKLGRIGDQSFDERAGKIDPMFDFKHPRAGKLTLDPTTGEPAGDNNEE